MSDPLYAYHQHTFHEKQVQRPDLVHGLAAHALRFIPHHEHVLKEIVPRERYVTNLVPQPYTDSGKMQMIHH